jgi:tetratricopeptide (TPR) repeat protein
MSRRSPNQYTGGKPSRMPGLLLLVAAFAAGSGVTWLLRAPASAPGAAHTEQATDRRPPDVSTLSPAQAATTLGNWNYDQQNWPLAIKHYEQALALGLDNADLRTDLGNCYRFAGEPQRALEQYSLAQEQNPQHEASLFNTGATYQQSLHDDAHAAGAFRQYLKRFPNGQSAESARRMLAETSQAGKPMDEATVRKMLEPAN